MVSTARSAQILALCGVSSLLAPSCGGDSFNTGSAGNGNESGAGSSSAAGQAGSDEWPGAGNGGASEGGDANVGGAETEGCATGDDCEVGQFCRAGSCVSCADLSDLASLAFGPAEPFEVINETAKEEGLRFARRLPDGKGLVYVRDFFGGVMWSTNDPETSAGAQLTKADVFETGPLPFEHALPEPLTDVDFFFSRRARVGVEPLITRLFGAKRMEDGTLGEPMELTAPFNSEDVVASYGFALATSRAVWTRNVNGQLAIQLVTSPLPPNGAPTPLSLPLPERCGFAAELDYAPWLSPNGKLLLFSARRVDQGCEPASDAISHVYALELSAAGQPVGNAHVLDGMLDADIRQTDASLSPDGCELLLSAQRDTAMRLYRAPRIR